MGKYPWSGKRTLDHCKLITAVGKPHQANGKCDGFQKSEDNDEPCETCMNCKLNTFFEDDSGKTDYQRDCERTGY